MSQRDWEAVSLQTLGQVMSPSLCVDEDHCLSDLDGGIEVAQGLILSRITTWTIFPDVDVELFDPLEGELSSLHEDGDWVSHEGSAEFQGLWRKSR